MDLIGRDFLTLLDFTPAEIGGLLDLAAELKAKKKAGIPHDTLRGKNVALIFEKTSTRTRCSFEVAAHDLGMGTTYLDPTGSGHILAGTSSGKSVCTLSGFSKSEAILASRRLGATPTLTVNPSSL